MLDNLIDNKKYKLEENYRNSQKITEYCINTTGFFMKSVGVDDGQVYETQESDEKINVIIRNFINDFSKRKSIIVKELNRETKVILREYFRGQVLNFVDNINSSIILNKLNVLTVPMLKGMEFDSTLVFTIGMNNNEKYIALTRSLINNFVINSI